MLVIFKSKDIMSDSLEKKNFKHKEKKKEKLQILC